MKTTIREWLAARLRTGRSGDATGRRISWLALWDPDTGCERMCTWDGEARRIVVTGLPPGFAASAPMTFDLPEGAEVHDVPDRPDDQHDRGREMARDLGGVLFTVWRVW